MNSRRTAIAMLVGAASGLFCAYGTAMVQIPGVVVTFWTLVAIFYNRLLLGFVVGIADGVALLRGKLRNAALRGALLGIAVSLGIVLWSEPTASSLTPVALGAVYGLVADVLATKFGGK